MNSDKSKFELPMNIERYLATLSKLYAQEGLKLQQEIIVNSQVRVHEEWSSDNWNGGTYGHAIYLVVPESIYLKIIKQKDSLQEQITADLNKLHSLQNEFVEKVFLEMEVIENQDWRSESGLLLSGKRVVLPEAEDRIWGAEGFRVFLSHKSEVKKETTVLKDNLGRLGVSAFVAHKDIHPTKEWQEEIENALASMDAFVALMTSDFHESYWTDHEVGYALGRGVPIVCVKLGMDPYGLIGKYQALSCSWDTAATEIVKIFIKHARMLGAFIKAVKNCGSFDQGNKLSEILPYINKLTDRQERQLIDAFNENVDVRGSYGFNGSWPSKFGSGLVPHLQRITGKDYTVKDNVIIASAPEMASDANYPF